jgi:hypothetical protein
MTNCHSDSHQQNSLSSLIVPTMPTSLAYPMQRWNQPNLAIRFILIDSWPYDLEH